MKVKKATINDVNKIQNLINSFASEGKMLPRSLNEIYENIRDFWVIKVKEEVIACCALHIVWDDLAEIKSLAVSTDYQGESLGTKIVKSGIEEALDLKIGRIFALTYVPEFFEELGFVRGNKEEMPHKIWSECINCPHFPDCDEVLVKKNL
ncbi:MAG: N-acetyltransferase [Elusimicrobiota bacterium]